VARVCLTRAMGSSSIRTAGQILRSAPPSRGGAALHAARCAPVRHGAACALHDPCDDRFPSDLGERF
jgi:hypothetical protein